MVYKSRIKEYRVKSNMKQTELAKKVGVTRETIIRLEKGRHNPSLKLAMKIANVLETTVDELFYIEDMKQR